jgi:glyceraldehyde-3-phosphate dehydrogenase [NAD(P)+]
MMTEKLRLDLSKDFDGIYDFIDGIPSFKMLINGRWVGSTSGARSDVYSPVDESLIARVEDANRSDVDLAATAASEHRMIRNLPAIERIEIFECAAAMMAEHKAEIAHVLQLEAGKTIRDAEGEVAATIHRLRLTMEEARKIFGEYIPGDWSSDTVGKMALVIREPVGVVAAISPFNYPLYIASSKVIPALLAGNSVLLKPSSYNPISAILLTRILEASGIPEGSMNLVTGPGGETGDAITSSQKVNMVNFTGSTPVGRRISQMAVMKKLHLELGGKAYALVLEDADLDLAAKKCAEGSLKFAGQRCDAISAILALQPIADELSEKIVMEVDKWKFGNPMDESVMIGPVISKKAAERIHGMVTNAVENGAELLRGGKYKGTYYEPTVLDNVPVNADIAHEETFGPVVTIIRPKDEDEAMKIARASQYGLENCVFTESFYRMWRVAKGLECGEVTINDLPTHGVGYFPFGGVKESGMGREGVGYSIDEMTNLKTIVFNLAVAGLGKQEHSMSACKMQILYRSRHAPEDGE